MQRNTVPSRNPEVALETASGATFGWQDWFGVVASVGCAIHCAAMPFAITFLPALSLSFLAHEAFHRWMALVCFLIAMAAFVPGIRQHGRWTPSLIAIVGLSLITAAAFGIAGDCCATCQATGVSHLADTTCYDACCEHCAADVIRKQEVAEESNAGIAFASIVSPNFLTRLAPWLTPLGGMLLVSAHLLNRRYGCLCGCYEVESSATEGEQ